MGSLKGKIAIITGGGSGIGRGIAKIFARENAQLVISGIDFLDASCNQNESKRIDGFKNAKEFVEELKKEGVQAIAPKANVTVWSDVQII